jgi:hypothetical protein
LPDLWHVFGQGSDKDKIEEEGIATWYSLVDAGG